MAAAGQAPPDSASPHPTTNSQSGLGRVLSRLPQRWGRIRCSRRRGVGEEGDLPEKGGGSRGYASTKMSSGVVIGVGFQLSGGDSQMHELIWYSWLGGVILGTMIASNSVLEEHCKVGPRNVVITGRWGWVGFVPVPEFFVCPLVQEDHGGPRRHLLWNVLESQRVSFSFTVCYIFIFYNLYV